MVYLKPHQAAIKESSKESPSSTTTSSTLTFSLFADASSCLASDLNRSKKPIFKTSPVLYNIIINSLEDKVNMILSIVIPIFNNEKYLKPLLDSIINQTYKDLEIICVDDGSTDTTNLILKEYQNKDKRIKILFQDHKGPASARNYGLENATGEYISFIDSDDIVSVNLYKQITNILSKQKFDIIIFNAGFYDNKKKITKKRIFFTPKTLKGYEDEYSCLTYKNFKYIFFEQESIVNKVFKRSFLNENNIKFEENSNFEDSLFNFNTILKAKSISMLNKRLYLYRQGHNNTMNSKIFAPNSRMIFEIFANTDKMKEVILTDYPELKEHFLDSTIQKYTYYFMHSPKKIQKEFYNKMRKKVIKMTNSEFKDINKSNLVLKKDLKLIEKNRNHLIFYIYKLIENKVINIKLFSNHFTFKRQNI